MTSSSDWPKKYLELDETDKIIARISQGLAGWLTFQKFIKNRKSISEYAIYHPLHEIARNHEWRVEDQYRIKRCKEIIGRTIDFVLTKNVKQKNVDIEEKPSDFVCELSSTAVIEVKHIKHILRKEPFHIAIPKNNLKKNRENVRSKSIGKARVYFSSNDHVLKDIKNISLINSEFRTKIVRGYIIIIGNKEAMFDFIPKRSNKSNIRNTVYRSAIRILGQDLDCVFYSDGWRCDEVGEDYNKTTVLVLRNDGSWK